jgi:ubiquinone/menaquinone biosynthesis C-methylase UbiE
MTECAPNAATPPRAADPYDGLATDYDRARPNYPDAAIAELPKCSGIVVDVGAGTGIFTRQLALAMPDVRVVGLEPSADMRETARAASAHLPNVGFEPGVAERLPFVDQSASLITTATAVHWFDRPAFYAEAFRCLETNGHLVILQNIRRWWDSVFLAEYEELHEAAVAGYRRGTFPAADGHFRPLDAAGELSGRRDVSRVETRDYAWRRSLASVDFVPFSLSSTITQRAIAAVGRGDYLRRLTDLLERHSEHGRVTIDYIARVVVAERAERTRAFDANRDGGAAAPSHHS